MSADRLDQRTSLDVFSCRRILAAAMMVRDRFTMLPIDTLGTAHYVPPTFGTVSAPDTCALARARQAEGLCSICHILPANDPARADCGSCA